MFNMLFLLFLFSTFNFLSIRFDIILSHISVFLLLLFLLHSRIVVIWQISHELLPDFKKHLRPRSPEYEACAKISTIIASVEEELEIARRRHKDLNDVSHFVNLFVVHHHFRHLHRSHHLLGLLC